MHQCSILHSHDGGIDDFLALLLLTTMEQVQLIGTVVTPADCYLEPALSVTQKLLHWRGFHQIPVIASNLQGINPFPDAYRRDCRIIDRLPLLNEIPVSSGWPNQTSESSSFSSDPQRIFNLLQSSPSPVTWLETGPLSSLAYLLSQVPEAAAKIAEVIWMGGAIDVPGNVEPQFAPEHDGSAEWNVFWDPAAADTVLQSNLKLTICPLDATNLVPVTEEFTQQLSRQRRYPCADFAAQCYAIAALQDYYCWDVLTAAYLGKPDLFAVREEAIAINTSGPSQGRTRLAPSGTSVSVIHPTDPSGIRTYLLQQWSR